MPEAGLALRDALLAETDGNPFFVGEMVRHLAETRAIYQDDEGRWVTSADLRTSGLPISIREVIGGRMHSGVDRGCAVDGAVIGATSTPTYSPASPSSTRTLSSTGVTRQSPRADRRRRGGQAVRSRTR
jgi:hypothetical protein